MHAHPTTHRAPAPHGQQRSRRPDPRPISTTSSWPLGTIRTIIPPGRSSPGVRDSPRPARRRRGSLGSVACAAHAAPCICNNAESADRAVRTRSFRDTMRGSSATNAASLTSSSRVPHAAVRRIATDRGRSAVLQQRRGHGRGRQAVQRHGFVRDAGYARVSRYVRAEARAQELDRGTRCHRAAAGGQVRQFAIGALSSLAAWSTPWPCGRPLRRQRAGVMTFR